MKPAGHGHGEDEHCIVMMIVFGILRIRVLVVSNGVAGVEDGSGGAGGRVGGVSGSGVGRGDTGGGVGS